MYRYVETICAQYGKIELIDYHNERLNRTRRDLFGSHDKIDLRRVLKPDFSTEKIKVRVLYDLSGIVSITYTPYAVKQIETLQFVESNDIEYSYKREDRTELTRLSSRKKNCDEVLIVKNGLITDTTYTNVAVLIDGQWLTPRTPLLKGTRRASLIDKGLITEADISPEDINEEMHVMLFNGMIEFGAIISKVISAE